ncbi:regulatory protein ArsR [Anaeromyxobacter sp. Fw109-5]|nr:regulatory protein ArsR [Anaeromyxobacter sp. Fw109-5]
MLPRTARYARCNGAVTRGPSSARSSRSRRSAPAPLRGRRPPVLNRVVDNHPVEYDAGSMTSSDALSTTLSALADPTRRHILARLASGDATVKELAAPYEMSLAAVSKHLKVLEGAGLITRSREAQRRPCHLEAEPLRALSDWLDEYRRFWERSFESLGDYVKTLQHPPRGGSPGRRTKPRPGGSR